MVTCRIIGAFILASAAMVGWAQAQESVPRAVSVAQATAVPDCTVFVDAAGDGDGTRERPYKTITAGIEAATPGAIICVAEGTYPEQLAPGEKYFTLAGGFQSGSGFAVRDSAQYVTKAAGNGSGSFLNFVDPAPKAGELVAVDGFDISGYSRPIVRDAWYSQNFDITNNFIHDNVCKEPSVAGAGFALSNVSGVIRGNVIRNNSCDRGGAGFIYDGVNENTVHVEGNLIEGNAGTEAGSSHGGALYLFVKTLTVTANRFTDNSVTAYGAGLYIGAYRPGGVTTTATLSWNVYSGNRAGGAGGGLFCDDGATCISDHEIFFRNCGANIYLDTGSGEVEPTTARFDHLTNFGALDVDCKTPGAGVRIDKGAAAADSYSFVNALFWGNAPELDFANNCDVGCDGVTVNVSHSMVQTAYMNNNLPISFGEGNVAPTDPLFADTEAGDFHLKSTFGRWTPDGYAKDDASSPVLGLGDPGSDVSGNPESAGKRIELGAYGNSPQASLTR